MATLTAALARLLITYDHVTRGLQPARTLYRIAPLLTETLGPVPPPVGIPAVAVQARILGTSLTPTWRTFSAVVHRSDHTVAAYTGDLALCDGHWTPTLLELLVGHLPHHAPDRAGDADQARQDATADLRDLLDLLATATT